MLPIDNRRDSNIPTVNKARGNKVQAQSINIAIEKIHKRSK